MKKRINTAKKTNNLIWFIVHPYFILFLFGGALAAWAYFLGSPNKILFSPLYTCEDVAEMKEQYRQINTNDLVTETDWNDYWFLSYKIGRYSYELKCSDSKHNGPHNLLAEKEEEF